MIETKFTRRTAYPPTVKDIRDIFAELSDELSEDATVRIVPLIGGGDKRFSVILTQNRRKGNNATQT